jgi:hypothetical protein
MGAGYGLVSLGGAAVVAGQLLRGFPSCLSPPGMRFLLLQMRQFVDTV